MKSADAHKTSIYTGLNRSSSMRVLPPIALFILYTGIVANANLFYAGTWA